MSGTLELPKHPFTPPRQIKRSLAPSPETPYSPAEVVEGFGSPEARNIAKEATHADEILARARKGLMTPERPIATKTPNAPVKRGGKTRRHARRKTRRHARKTRKH
jgi:hypothetical protein